MSSFFKNSLEQFVLFSAKDFIRFKIEQCDIIKQGVVIFFNPTVEECF